MVKLTGQDARPANEWERIALILTLLRDENEMDERSPFVTQLVNEALHLARVASGEDVSDPVMLAGE